MKLLTFLCVFGLPGLLILIGSMGNDPANFLVVMGVVMLAVSIGTYMAPDRWFGSK